MPSLNSKAEYVVGVDLGGTKILAGVFNPALHCVGTAKLTTKAGRGASVVIERIARCVREAVDECDLSMDQIRGVGLGTPGSIDFDTGEVIFAGNLGWKNVPLGKELRKALGLPVFVENDCTVCTLGVHEVEFHGQPRNLAGIYLGTGIGGGLVLDGKMYGGHNGTAGEIGHTVLQIDGPKCSCGSRGCFEALASRTALFRQIKEAVHDGQKTVLTEMLGDDLEDMRSGDLRKAIKRGDKLTARVVKEAARYTGIAAGNLINLLNPEVVVIGGGVITALEDEMMPTIVKAAHAQAFPGTDKGINVVASKLGDDAGITGGAVLAQKQLAKTAA